MTTEADLGAMWPQAEERQQPPEAARDKEQNSPPQKGTALLTP